MSFTEGQDRFKRKISSCKLDVFVISLIKIFFVTNLMCAFELPRGRFTIKILTISVLRAGFPPVPAWFKLYFKTVS